VHCDIAAVLHIVSPSLELFAKCVWSGQMVFVLNFFHVHLYDLPSNHQDFLQINPALPLVFGDSREGLFGPPTRWAYRDRYACNQP